MKGKWAAGVLIAGLGSGTALGTGAPVDERATPTTDSEVHAQASPDSAPGRDALFGLDGGAGTKASTGELPGRKSALKVSGFYDFVLGYTYAGVGHWSTAVNRVQLNLAGDLGDGMKWKVGGRVDLDPVYFGSNFYLPEVKRNQRASAFWGENYLDFSAGGWDFRVGAQQIIWGEVVGLFVADVVSARDMREFLLPSFDIIRIPQAAVRAEYFFKNDAHLELVWIPVPTFDRIGKPGADFYPVPLPEPASSEAASAFLDPQSPSRSLSNSNYGVRANMLVQGWDLAAFYYRSLNAQPTFYLVPGQATPSGFAYQPRYNRIWQAGATVSKDIDVFVLRGEIVYTSSQNFTLANPFAAAEGVASRSSLDAIVNMDFSPSLDTRLNVQLFQRSMYGGSDSELALKTAGFGASVLASIKLGAFEPQILWMQNFSHAGGLTRPRVAWSVTKDATISAGVDIFTGPNDGFFGRYGDRDRVYAELRYDF